MDTPFEVSEEEMCVANLKDRIWEVMIGLFCSLCYVLPATLVVAFLYDFIMYKTRSGASLKNKHVVVTGGSSGIGKSFACEAAKRGANVTLLARDKDKLQAAELEVKKCCVFPTQKILSCSVDVTGPYERMEEVFLDIEKENGPVFMLMNAAGAAVCGALEDTTPSDIKKMLDLNCLGSILPTRAVIEGMKSRGDGHIIFTSSEAGFVGIYGLSPYSASKFALRGFAEALQMEAKISGIKVTVAYPPDTDTPGFAEEEKSKPKETRLICNTSGLRKPEEVAVKILNDALAGYFTSFIGMDGFMLSTLNTGMTPEDSLLRLFAQVSIMSLLRMVGICIQMAFYRIIKQCKEERNKSKKAE